MAGSHQKNELMSRQSLFDNLSMSDIEIECAEETISAHKAILSLHSPYFARLFSGTSKKARKQTSDLDLTEYDNEAMVNMLRHIYGLELEFDFAEDADDLRTICSELSILAIAHKYEVPSLIKLIEDRISKKLDNADHYGVLITEVDAVYIWSQGKHCRFVAEECLKEAEVLMKDEGFIKLLSKHPQLAADLLEEAVEADPGMAVELVKKLMEGKPSLALSFVKEAMKLHPDMAADVLPDLLALEPETAKKKRKRLSKA